jgi:hypothetical protein
MNSTAEAATSPKRALTLAQALRAFIVIGALLTTCQPSFSMATRGLVVIGVIAVIGLTRKRAGVYGILLGIGAYVTACFVLAEMEGEATIGPHYKAADSRGHFSFVEHARQFAFGIGGAIGLVTSMVIQSLRRVEKTPESSVLAGLILLGLFTLAGVGCAPDVDSSPAMKKAKQKASKRDELKWVNEPTATLRGEVIIDERAAVLTPKLVDRVKQLMKTGKIYEGRVWRGPGTAPMLPSPKAQIFIWDSDGEFYSIDLLPRNIVWPMGSEMRQIDQEFFDDVLGELYTQIIENGKPQTDDAESGD